jgi:hypothetical protein
VEFLLRKIYEIMAGLCEGVEEFSGKQITAGFGFAPPACALSKAEGQFFEDRNFAENLPKRL